MSVRVQATATKRRRPARSLVAAEYWWSTLAGAHVITVPLYTQPIRNMQNGNSRLAGIIRSRNQKIQRAKVTAQLSPIVGMHPMPGELEVLMVRLSPGLLDTGNLWDALKATQDAIAAYLGVNDGPNSPVKWDVAQAKSKSYGVRLEFRITKSTQA